MLFWFDSFFCPWFLIYTTSRPTSTTSTSIFPTYHVEDEDVNVSVSVASVTVSEYSAKSSGVSSSSANATRGRRTPNTHQHTVDIFRNAARRGKGGKRNRRLELLVATFGS